MNLHLIDVICYIFCDVKFLLLVHCLTFVLHSSIDPITIYLLHSTKKWNRQQKSTITVKYEKAAFGHKNKNNNTNKDWWRFIIHTANESWARDCCHLIFYFRDNWSYTIKKSLNIRREIWWWSLNKHTSFKVHHYH